MEQKLYTALTGSTLITTLSSNRIYPLRSPQDSAYPHIIYTRISGERYNGLSGYLDSEHPTVQIDIYSTSYSEAKSLSLNVHTVMDGTTTFKAILLSDSDLYEDAVDKYRVTADYGIINNE